MERDMTGTIYRSRDGSPETDRFPVTNYHSRYATGKSDSHHFPWLGCYNLLYFDVCTGSCEKTHWVNDPYHQTVASVEH